MRKELLPSIMAEKIAIFITKTRISKGFPQEYMANKLDISQAKYSKMEKGIYHFTFPLIETTLEIFDLTLPEFIFATFLGNDIFKSLKLHLPIQDSPEYNKAIIRLKEEITCSKDRLMISLLMLEHLTNDSS